MLKKRILASSLASVMALSSVSVVAFADETAITEIKTEAVSKGVLKEFIKEQEEFAKKELDKYGDIQSGRLNDAIEHAKGVVDDSNAEDDEITAAYQMLKAVKNSLKIYTAEELKELIASCKSKYDTNNVLNEDLQDARWTDASWSDFEDAYDDADRYVDSKDGRIICDAYCALDDALAGLKDAGYITKSEFRAVYNEFENIINSSKKYEDWRRGVCTVNPTTGGAKMLNAGTGQNEGVNLTLARFVTFEDLKTIVYGESDIQFVETAGQPSELDNSADLTEGTWIKVGANVGVDDTVEKFVKKAYDNFTEKAKATNKTSDRTIKDAYKAAKEAIAVFNGWKVDEYDSGNVRDIKKLNEANTAMLIKKQFLATKDGSGNLNGGWIKTLDTALGGNKLVVDFGAGTVKIADNVVGDLEIAIDKDGYILQDDTDGTYLSETAYEALSEDDIALKRPDFKKVMTFKAGNDITKYIPVNHFTVDDSADEDVLTGLLAMNDAYAFEERADKDDRDFATAANDTGLDAATINTWGGIAKYTGSAAEYTHIYRLLQYAYDDYNKSYKDRYTVSDIEKLIADADVLIEKTADAAALADVNTKLVSARKIAKEFVTAAKASGSYKTDKEITYTSKYTKDPDGNTWNGTSKYSTQVYLLLDKYYGKCQKKLKDYPASYGEILDLVAKVCKGLDVDAYGSNTDTLKKLINDISYGISVLDATGEVNEPFDEDRVAVVYNRVFIGDGSSDAEKTLYANYDALRKALEEGAVDEVVKGDADGDGKVTINDALRALKASVGSVTLSESEKKAADVDGVPGVTALDALAILKMAL